MNLHLAEIAAQIAPGARAALLVDQSTAGVCRAGSSGRPQHHLDPVAGETSGLNPQENVWQFLR